MGLLEPNCHHAASCMKARRTPGKDTGEQDNGNTVADAFFRDPIAQPDDHCGTGCEDRHDHDGRKHTGEAGGVLQNAVGPAHHKVETDGLHNCQDKGRVPGDLLDGLLSFGAFLRRAAQGQGSLRSAAE